MTKREAKKLIKDAVLTGRRSLLEPEAKALLSAWGIDVPKSIMIEGEKGLVTKFKKLTPPVALKVVSRDILHKSEVGGIVTGLKDEKEIRQALKDIKKNVSKKVPKAKIEGFLLEEMAPKGVEIIVGCVRDPQFGLVVTFGMGGTAVELMKDVSYRLAPLKKAEAFEMMKEVRGYPLFTGFRGLRPLDVKAVASAIIILSEAMTALKEITEIETNPLLVYENGVMAVDARVSL